MSDPLRRGLPPAQEQNQQPHGGNAAVRHLLQVRKTQNVLGGEGVQGGGESMTRRLFFSRRPLSRVLFVVRPSSVIRLSSFALASPSSSG